MFKELRIVFLATGIFRYSTTGCVSFVCKHKSSDIWTVNGKENLKAYLYTSVWSRLVLYVELVFKLMHTCTSDYRVGIISLHGTMGEGECPLEYWDVTIWQCSEKLWYHACRNFLHLENILSLIEDMCWSMLCKEIVREKGYKGSVSNERKFPKGVLTLSVELSWVESSWVVPVVIANSISFLPLPKIQCLSWSPFAKCTNKVH